jgi:carbamoyltransferase
MAPWVLGLGGTAHNGSACLLHGGTVVAAIQEERLVGIKRQPLTFESDSLAIRYCLDAAGIKPRELDLIVCAPTVWSKERGSDVLANPALEPLRNRVPVQFVPHHLAHAAGAFATSGFEQAAILVVDGMGSPLCDLTYEERRVAKGGLSGGSEAHSFYLGSGHRLIPLEKHLIDHGRWRCYNSCDSRVDLQNNPYPLAPADLDPVRRWGMPRFFGLGQMYDSVAAQIFGDPHNGPGKLMGLAPYGQPSFAPADFFTANGGGFDFLPTVPDAFGFFERWPAREQEYRDLAAATQKAFEAGMLHLVAYLRGLCDSDNLVIAGGCGLNGVANQRIQLEGGFSNLYVIPAAEDSGISVGAAYLGSWQLTERGCHKRLKCDSFGRSYTRDEIDAAVARLPMLETIRTTDPIGSAVDLLTSGGIVGLFQGGSELGPRALGQRSILCDPRRSDGKSFVNERVKFRESFRPFAPAIMKSHVREWFATEEDVDCPFMLRVLDFRPEKRGRVPAVAHVDGTGRLQTVTPEDNGILYDVIRCMFERTEIPLLLNTSFNLQSEPIVETPEDALWTLLFSGIDACLLERTLVRKSSMAHSPLLFRVRPNAEIVGRSEKSGITLATMRPYLGRWEWKIPAEQPALTLFIGIVQAARAEPTGGDFVRDLRTEFGARFPFFFPPRDAHVLALMRRSGLIRLTP